MPYADLNNLISDYLPEAKKASEIAAVGRLLDNVSAFVDTYCRRQGGYFSPLEEDSPAVERRFRGEDEHFLRLPVHVFGSVESVKYGETEFGEELYYESEKNGWIYLLDDNNFYPENRFDYSSGNRFFQNCIYKVTARFGYQTTPLDLQEAVRQIVVRWYETQKGTLGQITPNGFVIERDLPPSAKVILEKYKRREFEV